MPLDPVENDVISEACPRTPSDFHSTTRRTPLPIGQLTVLFLQRFCESASAYVIYPFLHELIASILDGDDASVGYYAGLMDSYHYLVSFASMMYWSRLSDSVGRKPVLMLGTFALAMSTLGLGVSKTFSALVLSRCLSAAFNSNPSIVRATIAEITDHTNSADAFALHHIPYAVGGSFASFIGGWLVHPQDRFPHWFPGPIWSQYPYLLPCLTVAILTILTVIFIFQYLRETVPGSYFYVKVDNTEAQPLLSSAQLSSQNPPSSQTIPFRQLLTKRTLPPLISYVILYSLHAVFNVLQAIFLAAPVNLGGLSLPPAYVGQIMGTYGLITCTAQLLCLGNPVRFFGIKKLYTWTMAGFVPMFMLPIWMNILARKAQTLQSASSNTVFLPESSELPLSVWTLLVFQMGSVASIDFAYSCSYLYITASSPSPHALGAINGAAQTLAAIGSMVAPGLAMGLVTYSVKHDILLGYFANVLLGFVALCGVGMVVYTHPFNLECYHITVD